MGDLIKQIRTKPKPKKKSKRKGITQEEEQQIIQQGDTALNTSTRVILDYTQRYRGITLLGVAATTSCPTKTPTPTPTITPTNTITPTVTPTNTLTPTNTPTPNITPSTSGVFTLQNECDIFTLFDMGVQCYPISEPSSSNANDGILSLKITGGTSPYNITWGNGAKTKTIYGIRAGSYPVQVVLSPILNFYIPIYHTDNQKTYQLDQYKLLCYIQVIHL